jgi:hypothetical protein
MRRGAARRTVEIAMVTAVLGIAVGNAARQCITQSDGGRLARVDAELAAVRAAIAAYQTDHGGTPPGSRDARDPRRASAAPCRDFEMQLTLFTDAGGRTRETRTATFRFGPYLEDGRLPVNPLTATRTLVLATAIAPTPLAGWTFDPVNAHFAALDAARRPLPR